MQTTDSPAKTGVTASSSGVNTSLRSCLLNRWGARKRSPKKSRGGRVVSREYPVSTFLVLTNELIGNFLSADLAQDGSGFRGWIGRFGDRTPNHDAAGA